MFDANVMVEPSGKQLIFDLDREPRHDRIERDGSDVVSWVMGLILSSIAVKMVLLRSSSFLASAKLTSVMLRARNCVPPD